MNTDTMKHRAIGQDTGERYTHDKKGGTYRVIAVGEMKAFSSDKWIESVTYADVYGGKVYTTSVLRWNGSFSIVPGPGYVNQD